MRARSATPPRATFAVGAAAGAIMGAPAMEKMSTDAVATFLGQTALFKTSPAAVLAKIAPHVDQKEVPFGHLLVQPGAPVAAVGIMFAGRAAVRLVNPTTGAKIKLDDVTPGDSFGEMGLLLGGPSSLSVMAEEDCRVFFIRKEHFEQVLSAVPAVSQGIARGLSSLYVKAVLDGSVVAPLEVPAATPPPLALPVAAPPVAPPSRKPNEIPYVELAAFNLTPRVLDLLPGRLIHQHRMLPLELRDRSLLVGMVNPSSIEARHELRRVLHNVDPEIAAISIDDFTQTMARLKLEPVPDKTMQMAGRASSRVIYATEHRRDAEKAVPMSGEESTAILDRILVEAVERGASDIHIEPESAGLRVRYRVQGMMIERKEAVPLHAATPVIARIKVLAELDITERRIPQDGRISATVGNRDLNFRVSTLATARGHEKVVMRILDPTDVMRPLEHIFVDTAVLEIVSRAITQPYGAIFVAGPTGSGKSSTLYSLLNKRKLTRPDNNIVTVEDPVELIFQGITQTSLNVKIGLDYPTVLRAHMRQDPDVIMVGELRDSISAGIAVEAALTGHLLLTSIHGSNSTAVLQRLGHFDIPAVLQSQAINMVVVQRLAPRLCAACVKDDEVAPAMLDNLLSLHLIERSATPQRLPRPVGCEACDRTGRKGRVAVVEVLSLQEDMRAVLASGCPPVELLQRAEKAGQFLSFTRYARMLIARKLLAPADALLVVSD